MVDLFRRGGHFLGYQSENGQEQLSDRCLTINLLRFLSSALNASHDLTQFCQEIFLSHLRKVLVAGRRIVWLFSETRDRPMNGKIFLVDLGESLSAPNCVLTTIVMQFFCLSPKKYLRKFQNGWRPSLTGIFTLIYRAILSRYLCSCHVRHQRTLSCMTRHVS